MNYRTCTPEELGPLPGTEKPFARRMRQHQGWYRAAILNMDCGTGPKKTSKTRYANMLTEADAAAGGNFLRPEIFELAKARLRECGGVMEEFRLLRNMLSSQPMCFNLFGYLGLHPDLAARWLNRTLDGRVQQVTRVIIEHNLEPREEYLNDRTAFDAFVEFVDVDDRKGFVGIETKLTEPFSQTMPPPDKPEYRRWMEQADSPWRSEAADKVNDVIWNQLWRDHLLAVATLHHRASPYEYGTLMLVRHGEDIDCENVTNGYKALLKKENNMFVDMPLHLLVRDLSECVRGEAQQEWLDAFRLRYLDLHASEGSIR